MSEDCESGDLPLEELARRITSGAVRLAAATAAWLVLSVMGDTNVELRVDPPVHVDGQDEPVVRIAFWADDPQAVVRLLRDRAVPAGH